MARTRSKGGRYTVGDHPGYESPGAALSYAQNQAVKATEPGAWYVRDFAGDTIYRVERDEERCVYTYTVKEVRR